MKRLLVAIFILLVFQENNASINLHEVNLASRDTCGKAIKGSGIVSYKRHHRCANHTNCAVTFKPQDEHGFLLFKINRLKFDEEICGENSVEISDKINNTLIICNESEAHGLIMTTNRFFQVKISLANDTMSVTFSAFFTYFTKVGRGGHCAEHEFDCYGRCIGQSIVCDGHIECDEGIDRAKCFVRQLWGLGQSTLVWITLFAITALVVIATLLSYYCDKRMDR